MTEQRLVTFGSGDEDLKKRVFNMTLESVKQGHYSFWDPKYGINVHSDQCIPPESVTANAPVWADLVADLILESSTSGIVGKISEMEDREFSWMRWIDTALLQRGAEFPVTELGPTYLTTAYGYPLENYSPGTELTIFTEIHTLGGEFEKLTRFLRMNNLGVNTRVCLIDRSPIGRGDKPISVMHLPLPIYEKGCPCCGSMRYGLEHLRS